MELLRQWGIIGLLGMVGLGLVGYGLWQQIKPTEAVVEIIKSDQSAVISNQEMYVDIAGAVEKPGVYKLANGSRIGDALVLAGGLSAGADREWVARTINLAEELKDAQKIYIPTIESVSENPKSEILNTKQISNSKSTNINTASVAELDKLEGIGQVRAQAIVDNRPYSKTEEIVIKAKVPQSVYDKIKDEITIY